MRLAQFYTAPYLDDALEAYATNVPSAWSARHKLDLYRHAKIAFESDEPAPARQAAFNQIYANLDSYWQVFRNASGPCWGPSETFAVLTTKCGACSRQSSLTTANLIASDSNYKVQACLGALGRIKATAQYPAVYPWMAVSKFLHFFNPRLFPIYDGAFMWAKVANGAFSEDYTDFCRHNGFATKENTVRFNLQYTLWASEIMAAAGNDCMATFSRWFATQVDGYPDPAGVLEDVPTYYAAAFATVAIGAAHM
jgi:hypothetical protein